ncbi:PAS domain S-box protein [Flavobacterium sp.]|uniref:sensor histidine kinase n=1 Tax=Flavobacterium sp. TaxID=239 RepID=UPI0038FC8E0D
MNQETRKISDCINFEHEFKDTLSFISEICEVPFAFITHRDSSDTLTITKISFDAASIPKEILLYNQNVIKQSAVIKISDLKKDSKHQSDNSNLSESEFCFFVGLPILDDQNVAVGSICIFDLKAKELSIAQLRSLEYAAKQISCKLEAIEQNKVQSNTIREKETQFQLFIDNSKEIYYELNTEGIISYVSKNWTAFLGHELHEVIGKNYSLFLHPEDLKIVTAYLNNTIEIGKIENEITYRILHKEGHYTWHTSSLKLSEKNGEINYIGNCRDITEHIEIQQKISQQKEFYEKILDQIPTDVAVFDQDHRYLYLNQAAINDVELRAFIIGKDDFEYAKHTGRDDSSATKRRAKFLQAMESKNLIQWEDSITSPYNGLTSYHTRKLNPVFHKDGTFEMMIGFGVNITESKKAEQEILKSKQLLNSIIDNVAVGIIIQNPQAEVIETNKSACEMLGITENQLIGMTSFDEYWKVFHIDGSNFLPEEHPALRAIKFLKPVKNVIMGVYRPVSMDMVWLLVDAVPVFDDLGTLLYVVCSFNDITALKKLEDELRQSEAKFKGAFEYSPAGMALVDEKGYYIEVNDKLCKILGYSNQEMKSLTFQEITYFEDLALDLEYKKSLDSGKTTNFNSEKRFIKKNNALVWTNISVSLVKKNKNEIYYIVQIIDITERKKIENQNKLLIEENNKNRAIQLNEAKNRYRFLAENSVDLICLHTLDTTFQYVSPSVVNILGYNPEDMEGKSLLDFAHPEDLKDLEDSFTDFIDEKVNDTTIARFRNNEGKYIWLETKANIIKEKDIKTGFQSSSRDITTRKEEEEIIEKTLIKERELNELRSNLVSTVSHEFRTPMTTIRTSAELISIYLEGQTFEKKPRLEKQLRTISEEIDRIVELMNSVLTISRDDAGKTNFNPVQFDLKQLCLEVIDTSYNNQKDGSKVQPFFKGTNFIVFADKNLMTYSIFNLLNNAFKYSVGSGDIKLILSLISSKVILEIIDFGIGIPEDDQQKLFNTFFRASNTNGISGTGLGLYIVKTFTEKNSGSIQLESVLGKGTKVTLVFPSLKL